MMDYEFDNEILQGYIRAKKFGEPINSIELFSTDQTKLKKATVLEDTKVGGPQRKGQVQETYTVVANTLGAQRTKVTTDADGKQYASFEVATRSLERLDSAASNPEEDWTMMCLPTMRPNAATNGEASSESEGGEDSQ